MSVSLRESDVATLVRAMNQISAIDDVVTFPSEAMTVCADVVPSEIITYNEVHPSRSRVQWWPDPNLAPADSAASLMRLSAQHPIIREHVRTGSSEARVLSDLLSEEEFHKLELYRRFFEPFGLKDQMAIGLPAPQPLIIGIAFNRSRRGFEPRERLMADLLRPHLAQAYRSSQLAATLTAASALALDDRAAVRVLRDGSVEPVGADLPAWLPVDELFPAARVDEETLAWLTAQPQSSSSELPSLPRLLVRDSRTGQQLVLRHVTTPGGRVIVITRGRETADREAVLRAMGLTNREATVLERVSKGATNAAIAAELCISTSAVKRHLEATFQKLGVRNRTEAATLAVDTIAHS